MVGRSRLWGALGVCLLAGCGGEELSLARRSDAVIYGVDGRREVYDHPDPVLRRYGREAAMVILQKTRVDNRNPDAMDLHGGRLRTVEKVCADEPFADQRTPGDCSATLIAPDLALTAGHCVEDAAECADIALVFRHYYRAQGQLETIRRDDVYKCKRLLVQKLSEDTDEDFAVVQLDRQVTPDHVPVPVIATSSIALNARVSTVGFPVGLPAKIDDGGRVRANDGRISFEATLDSFAGSSGSGVYDARHRLIGVLTQGNDDWVKDASNDCYRANRLSDDEASPETVVYYARVKAALCATGYRGPLCPDAVPGGGVGTPGGSSGSDGNGSGSDGSGSSSGSVGGSGSDGSGSDGSGSSSGSGSDGGGSDGSGSGSSGGSDGSGPDGSGSSSAGGSGAAGSGSGSGSSGGGPGSSAGAASGGAGSTGDASGPDASGSGSGSSAGASGPDASGEASAGSGAGASGEGRNSGGGAGSTDAGSTGAGGGGALRASGASSGCSHSRADHDASPLSLLVFALLGWRRRRRC